MVKDGLDWKHVSVSRYCSCVGGSDQMVDLVA